MANLRVSADVRRTTAGETCILFPVTVDARSTSHEPLYQILFATMKQPRTNADPQGALKKVADRNFGRWKIAILTGDPKKVSRLYSSNATFLPTVSPEFKKGKKGAEEYFRHFLEKNPTGEIVEEAIQPLGKQCYLHSGMYNFELGPASDRQTAEARFSFVWKHDASGEWEILHHHSSMKPQEFPGNA